MRRKKTRRQIWSWFHRKKSCISILGELVSVPPQSSHDVTCHCCCQAKSAPPSRPAEAAIHDVVHKEDAEVEEIELEEEEEKIIGPDNPTCSQFPSDTEFR